MKNGIGTKFIQYLDLNDEIIIISKNKNKRIIIKNQKGYLKIKTIFKAK